MRVHESLKRGLDAGEARLSRVGQILGRPRVMPLVAAGFVVVAILLRLPLVFSATDVPSGHNDTNQYFNQVYANWLKGNFYPDPVRGSGWQFILYLAFEAFGIPGGDAVPKEAALSPAQTQAALVAYALSAMLAAGIVAATYLLARLVLPPLGVLGALVLVTFDPYLLFFSTSAMSEPPYTVLLVLAIAAAIKARQHPAWLLLAAALLAGAHVLRVNGLVMLVMVLAFAWLLMRQPWRRKAWWTAGAIALFFLLLTPYLAWRADHLPGAFDYGTNQRFWADDLWDLDDAYWSQWSPKEGAPKETMGDYFAHHTLGDFASRLYRSWQWQVFDLFGFGKWPGGEPEGGWWPGTPPDGSALTPFVVALSLVAAFTALRRRELWFLPLAVLFTLATFTFIYPLVRSVRYFSPLIPLFVVFAMVGWRQLATHVRRPALVTTATFGGFVLLYGARPLLRIPEGLLQVAEAPSVVALVVVFSAAWLALVAAPSVKDWARARWVGRDEAESAGDG